MNIFIDLDGPILNNMPRLYSVYFNLVNALGFKPLSESYYWKLKRACINEETILRKTGCFDQKFIQVYVKQRIKNIENKEYLSLNKVTDRCRNSLRFLSKQGNLILVTARKSKENLMWELKQKGLYSYFKKVLCDFNDTITAWELKFDLINRFVSRINANDIIIGDTEAEILCGKKLGIYSIGVANGIRNSRQLSVLKPDMIVKNLTGVVRSWAKIEKEAEI